MTATYEVRCAVCGAIVIVQVRHDWSRSEPSMPDVWICDIHRSELHGY